MLRLLSSDLLQEIVPDLQFHLLRYPALSLRPDQAPCLAASVHVCLSTITLHVYLVPLRNGYITCGAQYKLRMLGSC